MASEWIDQYQQASFRGVEFFITSASNGTGRRINTHKFPDRDDVFHQDLGRKERTYEFDAYIIGGDYFRQREELIKACETPGPGKLVHPYRGELEVVCKNCQYVETTKEGRLVRFTLSFSQQKDTPLTATEVNTNAEVFLAQSNLIDSQKTMFEQAYDIASKPAAVLRDAVEVYGTVLDYIEDVKKVTGTVAEFQQAVQTIKGKITETILDATLIAQDINALISFGTSVLDFLFPSTSENSAAQYREMRDLFSRKEAVTTGTSPIIFDDPDYAPQQIQKFMSFNAAINSMSLVPIIPLTNVEDTEELRVELFETLDEIANDPITTDEMYSDIRDLRKAVNENLDIRILNLSTVNITQLQENKTTLNVTNEFYGNSAKEQGFIDLNEIIHPGMVPALVDIKVEVDATE